MIGIPSVLRSETCLLFDTNFTAKVSLSSMIESLLVLTIIVFVLSLGEKVIVVLSGS